MPGGNLGNSSAFGKGFHELYQLNLIDSLPRITVVQAEGASPFAALFARHESSLASQEMPSAILNVGQPKTLASAIKIGAPVSWKKAWRTLAWTNGTVLTVSEQEIADARAIIGRDGIGCEPASATTVAGIKKLVADGRILKNEKVVAVLTGHLLKDTEYVINYHRGSLGSSDGQTEGHAGTQRIASNFSNQPLRVKAEAGPIGELFGRLVEQKREK
jgi:threonine synthase